MLPLPDRARILAQWAVNVVDFRDADSAMTRFAYDATPFVATGGVYWVPDDGVVFGVEQPDLLMSETLAFHDMRIRKKPGSSSPVVYEQLRVPQGSVFLEFICPKTLPTSGFDSTLPPAMFGLYKLNSGVPALDLGATVVDPAGSATNSNTFAVEYPKWRVAFLEPQSDGTVFKDAPSKVYESTTAPTRFEYTYQIANSDAGLKWYNGTATANPVEPKIDRVLWFANIAPTPENSGLNTTTPSTTTGPVEDKIFRWTDGTNNATPLLGGGQYLVVAPREFTYLGAKKDNGVTKHTPSNHRIQVMENWLQIWNQDNDPSVWVPGTTPTPLVGGSATTAPQAPFSPKVRDIVTMTAGMSIPPTWAGDTEITEQYIGLNISEPTRDNYYDVPTVYLNSTDTTDPSDTANNAKPFTLLSKDAYIEQSGTGTVPTPMDVGTKGFLVAKGWTGTDYPDIKTEKNWSAAVLQRLAGPMRPFHEKYNPYITLDWMPIDLTVFSGEETLSTNGDIVLASRHKTGATLSPTQAFEKAGVSPTSPPAGTTFYSYHNEVLATPSIAVPPVTEPVHFDFQLDTEYYAKTGAVATPRAGIATFSTLGYLNPRFVIRGTWNFPFQASPPAESKDDYEHAYFLGSPGPNPWGIDTNGTLATTNAKFALKVPLAPYFPNRDFVNAIELTSVPLSSPGQFFQDFSAQVKTPLNNPKFPYTLDFEDHYLSPPHLAGPPAAGQERRSAILLDCVGVPSPWGDSWKVAHPESVRSLAGAAYTTAMSQTMLFENYRAPYNTIPTFLQPGQINLNTASEEMVYRGLMWNIMTPLGTRGTDVIPYMSTLFTERQGYTGPNSTIPQANPHLNNGVPTEFTKPFTSSFAADKFPEALQQVTRSSDVGPLRRRNLSDPTLRIYDPSESGVFPEDSTSLHSAKPSGLAYSTAVPLNSAIHNYPAARMSNLTTDRSNVFAIRMTLGYFEYENSGGAIGAEYGSEQGRGKRHRAFYLIDRSIPVGYQTGSDMNVDNCILLRSVVE